MATILTTSTNESGNSVKNDGFSTFQATLVGTAGVVDIEVSNNNSSWITAGTITLTASTLTNGFFAQEAKSWAYIRATSSGVTGAITVDVN